MNHQEIIDTAVAALGVEAATPLSQGGQKWVLRGTMSGQDVVIKIVPLPEGQGADVALERAQREVELLAAVESPHVVKILSDAVEIGHRPDAICWVEEYLDGHDVAHLFAAPWTDEDVQGLLLDGAAGLKACHDLDVVHRDLSPGNVRRLTTGRFVIMDPGFAKHLAKTALTGVYQPGTHGFRSPEHVPGGEPTPASDVFCLGILAFQARTGRPPIDASGPEDAYFQRLTEEQVPPIHTIDPTVADWLAVVIDRCLRRQPARRYLDGAELLQALAMEPVQ